MVDASPGRGGLSRRRAVRMLPYLEPEIFRRNPKPFVGYSDITALHLWLMRRAGLRVFHGPTVDDLIVPNAPVLDHSSGIPLRAELQEAERARVRHLAPSAIEHCRMPQLGLKRAKDDCKALGLRGRRNHDARRTFISC